MAETLNPNHPVTQEMELQYHKLLAILIGLHYDGATKIIGTDLKRFAELYPDAVLVVHSHRDSIELKLVTRAEGDLIALDAGGLPT